jgi:hypothetical protein
VVLKRGRKGAGRGRKEWESAGRAGEFGDVTWLEIVDNSSKGTIKF